MLDISMDRPAWSWQGETDRRREFGSMQISPVVYIDKYEEQVHFEGGTVGSKMHIIVIHTITMTMAELFRPLFNKTSYDGS